MSVCHGIVENDEDDNGENNKLLLFAKICRRKLLFIVVANLRNVSTQWCGVESSVYYKDIATELFHTPKDSEINMPRIQSQVLMKIDLCETQRKSCVKLGNNWIGMEINRGAVIRVGF